MGLLDTLMVSCRKASELIERRELRPLGVLERMKLRFHLRICDGCKTYERQSARIDNWLERQRDDCAVPDCTEIQSAVLKRIQ